MLQCCSCVSVVNNTKVSIDVQAAYTLLAFGASVTDEQGCSPILRAIESNDADMFHYHLRIGLDSTTARYIPLVYVVEEVRSFSW